MGIHRLKEEFTRFEFYGRTSGDHYRSTCFRISGKTLCLRSWDQCSKSDKYDFFIFGHTLSYDLDVSIQLLSLLLAFVTRSCLLKPLLSSALFIKLQIFKLLNTTNVHFEAGFIVTFCKDTFAFEFLIKQGLQMFVTFLRTKKC